MGFSSFFLEKNEAKKSHDLKAIATHRCQALICVLFFFSCGEHLIGARGAYTYEPFIFVATQFLTWPNLAYSNKQTIIKKSSVLLLLNFILNILHYRFILSYFLYFIF